MNPHTQQFLCGRITWIIWMSMLLLDGCASLHFFYRMCPSFSFLYFSRRNKLIRPSPAILHSLTEHSLLFRSSWLLLTVQFPTCFNIWTMMISQMWQVLWYFLTVYFCLMLNLSLIPDILMRHSSLRHLDERSLQIILN